VTTKNPKSFLKSFLLAGIIPVMGCASLDRQSSSASSGAAVRKTSNPDAVKGCSYVAALASGTFNSTDQQIGLMIGTDDPRNFVAYLPAGGGVGEVYDCSRK